MFFYDLDGKPKDAGFVPRIVQVTFCFWTTEVLSDKGICVSGIS